MHTTISARGFAPKKLEFDIRTYAKYILGRLRRHITHAELALKEDECTLRLRLYDSADIVVLARGAGKIVALTRALRHARHALLRRRAAQHLSPRAWRGQVQLASG